LCNVINSSKRSAAQRRFAQRQKTWVRFAKKALVLTVSAVAGFAVAPVAGVANSQIARARPAQASSAIKLKGALSRRPADDQPTGPPPFWSINARSTSAVGVEFAEENWVRFAKF
jgi:hypothetical protein